MAMREWVKLPSAWVQDGGLKQIRWGEAGADNIAALMALLVIAHHADPETGIATLTYDQMSTCVGLSRSKLSGGLSVLEALGLVDRTSTGRSKYLITNYNPTFGYYQIPARNMYVSGSIYALADFHLRHMSELDALKLYFLFAARRDRETNIAWINYDKITSYTAIDRKRIKQGLSLLTVSGLIHVETRQSLSSEFGIANGYRLAHLHPYKNMATVGRSMDAHDFQRLDTGIEDVPF